MGDVNDKLERLIVRGLDGVLNDEQQLELDRELIRNQGARRMMDEYHAADELAAAALADIASQAIGADQIVAVATQEATAIATLPRRSSRTWLLIPGAIAAAVLAMVIPKPSLESPKTRLAPIVSTTQLLSPAEHLGTSKSLNQDNAPMQTVGNKPSIRRRAGTEWIGVMGDDGNVYWIEVERSRTIRTPQSQKRSGGTFLEM